MNTLLRQAEAGNSGSKVAGFNKRRFRVRVGGHTAADPVTEFHGFSGVFSYGAVCVPGLGRVGQISKNAHCLPPPGGASDMPETIQMLRRGTRTRFYYFPGFLFVCGKISSSGVIAGFYGYRDLILAVSAGAWH